jgi:hypothetical protein
MNYRTAIRVAIVAKLEGDPYFMAIVPTGLTYRPSRQPVTLPAVTYRDTGVRSDNLVPLYDRTLYIDIWSNDLDQAEDIAEIINGLLDLQPLPLDPSDPYSETTAPGLVPYINLRGDEDLPQEDADLVRKMLTYRVFAYDYNGPEPFGG